MGKGVTRTGLFVGFVGIVLFALSGSALAAPPTTLGNVGQNGPTIPKLGDPVATQSEVQWITVTLAASPSGTYTLATGAGTTVAIAYNASPSAALTTLYGSGNISVAGGLSSANYDADNNLQGAFYWRVMWVKAQAGVDIALMTANTGGLTNVTVTVDPYEDGAVISPARNMPHGGFNATTDYCLQCHSVHQGGEYALLASSSVTATCRTCHSLFGANPGGARNPGFPGTEAPTSMRSAYEVTSPAGDHALGASSIPFSTVGTLTQSGWAYGGFNAATWSHSTAAGPGTASDVSGGLYCADCHTPHGDFGQLINSKYYRSTAPTGSPSDLSTVYTWQEDAAIYVSTALRYLHYNAATKTWQACNETADITCADLTTTDTEGENAYVYGYKLLSAYPNHSWDQGAVSWGMDYRSRDQTQWCGRCHDEALPSEWGGTFHNHPTGCTSCHTNPNDGTSTDFPHTSTFQKLLRDYPDLLCINCHASGTLP
jgi:predicted CXXCH cytochrome family protein